ncbi:MAG: hypothetical protein WC307_00545 [Candidatus Nanoarchaeia archaeon]|jgi:adenylylsulfate kinase-like enzyme
MLLNLVLIMLLNLVLIMLLNLVLIMLLKSDFIDLFMDNPKIICFEGKAKIGKSTTIKKILEEYFKSSICVLRPKIRKDFCLSFIHNGKIIGICSVGDAPAWLKKYLIPLKEKGCDVIICASHPTKKARELLRTISNNIEFIECYKPNESDKDWEIEHSKRIEEFKKIT